MKWLFWLLVIFAVAALAAVGAQVNTGYALIVWAPYRIEVSLNLAVVVLLVAFLLFYWILRSLASVFSLPRQVSAYRARRRQEKGQQLFHDAFRLLFEGRFGQALKKAAAAPSS